MKDNRKNNIRKEMLLKVRDYYRACEKEEFVPGKSRINYSGRVYDEKELVNLVDASLDFWLTAGRYADKFEKGLASFLGVKYCLLTNSGSSANLLAVSALTSPLLKSRRLIPGDEIITTACGFPTTLNPILQNKLIPVFVDVELGTYNIDVSRIEKAISKKTKAIFIAHTLGNPVDLDKIMKVAKKHNLWFIEDNCDSLGSKYKGKYTGTFGDISTCSFYPAHHMSCSSDTQIPYLDENKKWKKDTIENIYKLYVNKTQKIKIIAFSKDNKIKWVTPSSIIRHAIGSKKMLKIVTQHGREVKVTEDHSVFIIDQNTAEIKPKFAKDITVDDYVVATNNIPMPKEIKYIDILNYFKDKDAYVSNFNQTNLKYVKNSDYRWQFKSRNTLPLKYLKKFDLSKDNLMVGISQSKKIPARIHINEELCRLIGYYIAEGSYQNGLIFSFNKNEKDLIEDVTDISKKLFGIVPSVAKIGNNAVNVEIQSKNLEIVFKKIFKIRSYADKKRLPIFLYHCNENCIKAFVYGYTRGDGSLKKAADNTNHIDVTSVSRELLNDFQYLLSMIGISACFYQRNKAGNKKIGKVEFYSRENNTLSFSGYIYKNRSMYKQNIKDRNNISIQIPLLPIFRKYISVSREQKVITKNRLLKYLKSNKKLFSLVSSGLSFLRVRKVEKVNCKSDEYVYDFSVPGKENFYGGFLGIFLHNTMGEGGSLLTSNTLLRRIILSLRDWGRDCWCEPGHDNTCGRRFSQRFGKLPYGYDHKYVYSHIGYNLKVTDMQAAVGVAQLKKLPRFIEVRKKNFAYLHNHLKKYENYLILPEATENSEPSWFGFPILVKENATFTRNDIVNYLEKNKIATRMLFGGNLTKQPAYQNIKYRTFDSLKNTDIVMNNLFWIGVYPGITREKFDYIVKILNNFLSIK